MSEQATITRQICGRTKNLRAALSNNEQLLITTFRKMTDQDKHQIMRLVEALTRHPESP